MNGDRSFDSDTEVGAPNGFSDGDELHVSGLVSPTVAARHEELKKKRQVLNNPALEVSTASFDTERTK